MWYRRPWRDGGRDATGLYRIGAGGASLDVVFSLEAKLYSPDKGVGVKEVSRLISRLRHRQFGILVTTSYLSNQAYNEIQDDEHPVIVIAGSDVSELLIRKMQSIEKVKKWVSEF